LPRWPAEDPGNYRVRASMTQVARYYGKTVEASVGMIVSEKTLECAHTFGVVGGTRLAS
jgi:hypothetical protein